MSEETKSTAELTDKQLEKVAGGEGGGTYSFKVTFKVINSKGANIYAEKGQIKIQLGTYSLCTLLRGCILLGNWAFVPGQYGHSDGYVQMSDLQECSK